MFGDRVNFKDSRLRLVGLLCSALVLICGESGANEKRWSLKELRSHEARDPIFNGRKTLGLTIAILIPDEHAAIVTDGTDYALLRFPKSHELERFKVGEVYEVTGRVKNRISQITIVGDEFEKAGIGKLPDPERLPKIVAKRGQLRAHNLEQIIVRGRLVSASRYEDHVRIRIQGHGNQFYLEGPVANSLDVLSKVGAHVRVRGFLWFPYNQTTVDTPLDVPRLIIGGEDAVEVFGRSTIKLDHLSGEIVKIFEGERTYLQQAGGTKLIRLNVARDNDLVRENGVFDWWGHMTKDSEGDGPIFNVASFSYPSQTVSGASGAPTSYPYDPGDDDQHLRSVTVVGSVQGRVQSDERAKFLSVVPDGGGAAVRVIIPPSSVNIEQKLGSARRVEVTGYLDLSDGEPMVHPRYFDDIKVLGQVSWVQTATFRWVVFCVFLAFLGSLGMVAWLRIAVYRRTRALDHSLGMLASSYDAIYEGICLLDADGKVIRANPRFWEVLGIEKGSLGSGGVGERISQCFREPREFLGLWNRLAKDTELTEEGDLKLECCDDGEVRFYTAPTSCGKGDRDLGRVWVFKDMTEQRRLESTLLQSQKMEAVGCLAGGVAHDFNNLLTGIIGNLDLVRLDSSLRVGELEAPLHSAEQAARRGAVLIKSLLGFSRQEKLAARPSCANEVVAELIALVRPTLDPKVSLEGRLDEDICFAVFDPTKLEQVVLNMVVNARDALDGSGDIVIATSSIDASHPETGLSGRYVCIRVSDDGSGMSEGVRRRVFEPFFTTKEQGKGTGLGLATSYGIVQQMAGWITCESEIGEGTSFSIYLPEIDHSVDTTSDEETENPARRSVGIAREEIEVLCVDDELVVRRVAEGLLSRSGFRICSAEHGRSALDLFAKRIQNGEELPDIIISDLTMPVMDGQELLVAVRDKYPDIPFVICSGYLVDLEEFSEKAGTQLDGFIQKPYDAKQMVECIEDLMEKTMLVV